MMKKRWKDRFPALATHEWGEPILTKHTHNKKIADEYKYKCKKCLYEVYFNKLGFGKDRRGTRTPINNYSFLSCDEVLIKDIII